MAIGDDNADDGDDKADVDDEDIIDDADDGNEKADGDVDDEDNGEDDDGSSTSLSAPDRVILLGKKAHNKHTKITLLQDFLKLKCQFFHGL